LTRRNDPTITVQATSAGAGQVDPVRNGQRWRVAAIDAAANRVAAQRLGDGTGAVFEGEYLREHVSLGYAVTVHAAQGVTADTTHAVIGETGTRSLLYVAMTRGRHANTAYLHQRTAESDAAPAVPGGIHVPVRGTGRDAADIGSAILAHDDPPATAHQIATNTERRLLPDLAARLVNRRSAAVARRRTAHHTWQAAATQTTAAMTQARARAADGSHTRDRSRDEGLEL
jgi:hypothetical protein